MLKFGVMCSGTTFRSWQAKCITELLLIENVHLSLLIIDDASNQSNNNEKNISKSISHESKNKKISPSKILNFCKKVLNFLVNVNFFPIYKGIYVKSSVDKPVDLSDILKNVDKISCKVKTEGKYSQYFEEQDLKKIQSHDLDFILRFGFNIIRGEILSIPRFGVWSFHHDDEEKYRGGPACFWEIYYGDPVSGAILQKLTDRLDGGIVLKKGYFKTNLTSYPGNIEGVYKEAAMWPIYVVRDIFNDNAHYFQNSPSSTEAPIYKSPSNLQMINFLLKIWKRKLLNNMARIFKKTQWNIGIINEPIEKLLENNIEFKIHWYPLKKTDNFFLADPFSHYKNNKLCIFCEKCDLSTNFGEIVAIQFDTDFFSKPTKKFQELSCHLSYPYLFEYNNEIFLIPESRKIKEISLFKANNFPQNWVKVASIAKEINASDSTVFYYDQMWWCMYTDQEIGENSSLCILYAKDLLGPWIPHAGNPVKQDIRSSRPAGTPFLCKGTLYRPSQDCSIAYGGRIIINKITSLTPTEYKEEFYSVINPFYPFLNGIHTISSTGKYTIIDGCRSIIKL